MRGRPDRPRTTRRSRDTRRDRSRAACLARRAAHVTWTGRLERFSAANARLHRVGALLLLSVRLRGECGGDRRVNGRWSTARAHDLERLAAAAARDRTRGHRVTELERWDLRTAAARHPARRPSTTLRTTVALGRTRPFVAEGSPSAPKGRSASARAPLRASGTRRISIVSSRVVVSNSAR